MDYVDYLTGICGFSWYNCWILALYCIGTMYWQARCCNVNAILRESVHEIPTDPISDPIVDSKVLPIPVGDLSFGSGAQLKNSVGNWIRWLTEFLGKDVVSSSSDGKNSYCTDGKMDDDVMKCFPILNALSDLLMLPKDMLMDPTVRMEVCPQISLPLVKRVLCNFTPDEFFPDPVLGDVLEALNAERFFVEHCEVSASSNRLRIYAEERLSSLSRY